MVLAAAVLGSIMAVAAGEVAVRVLSPAWLEERMRELSAGASGRGFGTDRDWPVERSVGRFVRFVPGSQFRVWHYEYEFTAHIDELGGRETGSNRTSEILPFLGDSFTFGVGVGDRETFVSLYASSSARNVRNLGAPGSCLSDHLDVVEARHPDIGRPRNYVFCFFLGNDFEDLRSYSPSASKGPGDVTEARRDALARIDLLARVNDLVYHNPVLKRSYLLQLGRQVALTAYNRNPTRRRVNPLFELASGDPAYVRDVRTQLGLTVERLASDAASRGFRPVFVAIPDVYQVDSARGRAKASYYSLPWEKLDMTLPNRVLREELGKRSIALIDPTPCLEGRPGLYYTQDNHLTAAGHRALFECVRPALDEALSENAQ